jgi:pimeloyl-ACP methyl ester carboxylesterase
MSDHIVNANGVELCVETFGDPADPAILLVHGAGNSMVSWDEELCERFAAGRRFVIRYDMRDAGRSVTYEPGAPEYGFDDLVEDAAGLLDAFGIASAHIVGLSAGAVIGQRLALDHPERVASLTLASTTPGSPGREQADLPGATEELNRFFADEPAAPDWSDRAAVIEYIIEAERPFSPRFDEAAMCELAGRIFDRSANVASSLTNVFVVEPGERWRHRLGEISAPTLVIHGLEDPMFQHPHGVALAAEIPGAELLSLEDTGHEYFPRATWDVVVPAVLRISDRGSRSAAG